MLTDKIREKDKKKLDTLLWEYLAIKNKHKESWGKQNRYKLRISYQEMEDRLWYGLEDEYHFNGFVIMKGIYTPTGRKYLQVFTEESFKRMKQYKEKK